ncbi:unnamed protein product [Parnassius mnemosyne]|uniref:NTF2 domain-containing protein n=1 Tax=Parnassius mnemosyne TaxID=213953 RepID=A0AAV1LJ82_9NEOP
MSRNSSYRKFFLNRVTASKDFSDYLENEIIRDDVSAKHCFHKIMVHNWTEDDIQLFNIISEYFNTLFIPVDYLLKNEICSFYTSSLTLVSKIVKLDFMFPYRRRMFNVDILFNDKTSADCFEIRSSIDDIVSSVVCNRFNEKMELNLSNFCNDPEFVRTKLNFYKLGLLANFKILMLRMGRDTKVLNLSDNQLIEVPLDILNFFIKGELIGLNLSNNNIPSIEQQFRVSSKIEKLWLEGNPLCQDMDIGTYIKKILVKFPRLTELDGVKINQYGILYPFSKYFIEFPDTETKIVVENFLMLYFSHYDTMPRKKIDMFYDTSAILTISTDFSDQEEQMLPHYANNSRNAMNPAKRILIEKNILHMGRDNIVRVLSLFPDTVHDLNTFTVDVLQHNNKILILVIDGIYKEKSAMNAPENFIQFRRTFIFNIHKVNSSSVYHISNEMFSISLAKREQIENSFKFPTKNMNDLCLLNPDESESQVLCEVFMHLTMLKKFEAERRLESHNWDIRLALEEFVKDMKIGTISHELLMEDDNHVLDSSSEVD